jgi:hypothetical protein
MILTPIFNSLTDAGRPSAQVVVGSQGDLRKSH